MRLKNHLQAIWVLSQIEAPGLFLDMFYDEFKRDRQNLF